MNIWEAAKATMSIADMDVRLDGESHFNDQKQRGPPDSRGPMFFSLNYQQRPGILFGICRTHLRYMLVARWASAGI